MPTQTFTKCHYCRRPAARMIRCQRDGVATCGKHVGNGVARNYPYSATVSPLGAVTDTAHRYVSVYGGEVWCDEHDSAWRCTVTDETDGE